MVDAKPYTGRCHYCKMFFSESSVESLFSKVDAHMETHTYWGKQWTFNPQDGE